MKTEWIARLKALANANYAKGYGWQAIFAKADLYIKTNFPL